MKREIKFRLWDNEERTMYNNNDIELFYFNLLKVGVIAVSGEMDEDGNITPYQYQKLVIDNFSLMQYTGLKDKNGKEIYEGDWCRAEYRTREGIITVQGNIVFDEFMWCVDCKNDIFSINRLHNFEVIGNIYENPELLGKEVAE